jgi:hypothetical protein
MAKSLKKLVDKATEQQLNLNVLLDEWLHLQKEADLIATIDDRYYKGASSFKKFLARKFKNLS